MKTIVSLFGEKNGVFERLNAAAADYASALGFRYEWAPQQPYAKQNAIDRLCQADIGIIDVEPYGEDIFRSIRERTRLLVRFGVGYDRVDLAAAARNGIAVARTAGANTLGVAEMAVALILSARRRLRQNAALVRAGDWRKEVVHETIGCTLGIVGFGAIGRAVAKLFGGFDCRLLVYDPHPDRGAIHKFGAELAPLDKLFAQADVVTLHLPYSSATHHLVDAAMLARMKQDAVIVNTSRGNIIDENALHEALKNRRIAGAGLDVFGAEPLPLSSPLLSLDNIVLAPHVASQTEESLWRIYKMAIDIAADFFAGKGSAHILNPEYAQSMHAG